MGRGFVRPPTLAEGVVVHVREGIFRGEFEPGAFLRESQLAKALDVSRNTVREAQRLLTDEGLVEVIPHKGAHVIELSPRMVRELYSLRAVLEPHAVRMALEEGGYSAHDLEKLELLLAEMAEAEREGDVFTLVKTDAEFHLAMCEPSRHSLLLETLARLQARVRLCVASMWARAIADVLPQEHLHRQVLDAICAGDASAVERVIVEHLDAAGSKLLAELSQE